jgi:hypothetical protein
MGTTKVNVMVGVAVLIASARCNRTDPVATSSQRLTITTLLSSESTLSIARCGASCLAIGYEDKTGPGGVPSLTLMGWAFSVDNGVSWTQCNAGGLDACAAVVPPAGHKAWLGKPSVVSDGNGNVFYATLSDTDGDFTTAERVTVALSSDGGNTFGQAQFVNFDSGCSGGQQDAPTLALDKDQLIVAWRNKSANSFGGCVKRAHINSSPLSLSWSFGDARGIGNMDREGNGIDTGQGLVVQARGDGSGTMTVLYMNNDQFKTCPSKEVTGVAWASVTSYDGGDHWTNHTRFLHTDSFQGCIKRKKGQKLANLLRAYGFVRSPSDGHYYVAVNDTANTIRLFTSASDGNHWREACGTATPSWALASDPSQTATPCAAPFVTGTDEFVYMPSLGVTIHGGLILTFYQSDPGDVTWSYLLRANSHPLTTGWNAPSMFTAGITPPNSKDDFLFGNYTGVAVDSPAITGYCAAFSSTVFAAWIQADAKMFQQPATSSFSLP